MSVDSTKSRRILVVHGVEAGTDEDQHQDEDTKKLVETRLNGAPLDFETAMYRYEGINDKAQRQRLKVFSLFRKNFCEDAPQDDLDRPKPYLKARTRPYEFSVSKRVVPNFSDEANTPKRPRCEGR